jgi:hypothetical protein
LPLQALRPAILATSPSNFGKGISTVGFGNTNRVQATGQGNFAANFGGNADSGGPSFVQAFGVGNFAVNLGGDRNIVSAGNGFFGPHVSSTLGVAFNAFGNDNKVTAIGPAAIAGAIGVNNHNGVGTNPPSITQSGPGVNIKTPLNP